MNSQKIVIGLTGEKGSGKETVGDLLIELFYPKKVLRIRSSDILRETLTLWGLPLNRHNLQYMAIIMNREFGDTTLSDAVRARILSLEADIVIVDGMRWESDVSLIRSFKNNFLIYVTADAEIRYERTKKRKQKVGEESISFEQFLEEEKVATETLIPIIGERADKVIKNNEGPNELKSEVEKFVMML